MAAKLNAVAAPLSAVSARSTQRLMLVGRVSIAVETMNSLEITAWIARPMNDKTEVPLLTAEMLENVEELAHMLDPEESNGVLLEALQAIADGRAIVISAADLEANSALAALQLKVETLEARERVHLGQIESLRRDAERYRWLRDSDNSHGVVQRHLHTGNSWLPEGGDLDAAIDAALARYDASKGEK